MDDRRFDLPFNLPPSTATESPSPTVAARHDFVQIAPSSSSSSSNHHAGIGVGVGVGVGGAALAGPPIPPPPGSTVYTPTSAPSAELNPRSCVTCRRRKVRCDKFMPCSNCRRAMVPCIFPAPERAPRRPRRKDPNALKPQQSSEREIELLKRLRKLEGIVEELSGQVELETSKVPPSSSNSPEAAGGGNGSGSGSGSGEAPPRSSIDHGNNPPSASSSWGHHSPKPAGSAHNAGSPGRLVGRTSSYGSLVRQTKDTQKQLGMLMINDYGRARYVSSAFWSKINDELDELRAETQRISEPDSEGSETESSPAHETAHEGEDVTERNHNAFIFGFQSAAVDLRPLHPLPSQIPYIWQVYQENVDPVVKILHIPTTSKVIRDARTNLDNISPAAEALMFAIYYAAVNSLEDSEIQTNFMTEKAVLIEKYRFALEQSLAKANFLASSDLVTLQAFVLLLVLVRRQEDTRSAWTLTGLAIRIGHSIGLHRDGTNFPNLTPFEVEMRRRLFWALCILDMRCAEDQGTDLTILEQGVDTRPPLNINDEDISPESTTLPPAREGTTEMTFALIRFEICRVARRLHAIHSAMGPVEPGDEMLTLEERERMIHEVYDRVEKVYLKHADAGRHPAFWIVAHVARVICAKMTLVVYQPVLFTGPGSETISQEVRDRLFTACTELFEYSYVLTNDPRTKQWRWLFQTYTQWHAVAYALLQSSRRPWSASVERAWNSLNWIMSSPRRHDLEKVADKTSLLIPLKALYNKARKHRHAEIERLQGDLDEIRRLDREDRARLHPTMFSAYHGSLDGLQWRERWLRLVGAPQLIDEPEPVATQAVSSLTTSTPDPSSVQVEAGGSMPQQQQLPQLPTQVQQQPGSGSQQQQQGPAAAGPADGPTSLLNQVFSQPTFQPTDLMRFLNIAKVGDVDAPPPAAPGFGAYGDASMPPQDATLSAFTGAPLGGFDEASAVAAAAAAAAAANQPGIGGGGAPLVNDMMKDNPPPPWLWPDDGSSAQLSGVLADDTDMKMDEDFDWQDFGQTLGGISNGVWSSHGL